MTTCSCQVCIKRSARGEPALDGVSVAAGMHLTAADVEPPKRTPKVSQADAVTHQWVDALVAGIAEVISQEARRRKAQVAALQKHIDELEARTRPGEIEQRLATLEERTAELRYTGVWQSDVSYQPGNFTTDAGSLWHCNVATTSRPPGPDWQLAAKGERRTTRSGR